MEIINSLQALDHIIERSREQTVLLFKHSTRCSISIEVEEKEVRRFIETFEPEGIVVGLILVIENREVSLACANKLRVQHESPQVIILRDGKLIWNASHRSISYDNIAGILT